MTRKKISFWDRLRSGLSEVDKKMGTGQDVNDFEIKEQENQMDSNVIDGLNQSNIRNQGNFSKRSKKSYKFLR